MIKHPELLNLDEPCSLHSCAKARTKCFGLNNFQRLKYPKQGNSFLQLNQGYLWKYSFFNIYFSKLTKKLIIS